MANNSASSIRSALNTRLGAVTELQDVQIGRTFTFSGFPACRFYLSGIEDELKDNMPTNFRTYQFTIDVLQEMTNKTPAVAEADFEDAVDSVLDKLNNQWTLGSNVDVSVVENGSIVYAEPPAGPMLVCSILFSARTLIS